MSDYYDYYVPPGLGGAPDPDIFNPLLGDTASPTAFATRQRALIASRTPPRPRRTLPPAPIPAMPADLRVGTTLGQDALPAQRVPIPWAGPEHFFDPGTGTTYRITHGDRLQVTGHIGGWDPVDQWAAVMLMRSPSVPRDAGRGAGESTNFNMGRFPSAVVGDAERPTPQQVGQAIDVGAREVRPSRRAYSGLASVMPKVGPMIASTVGNAFIPGLGIVTGAASSALNQLVWRDRVDWREVGANALGGAAGFGAGAGVGPAASSTLGPAAGAIATGAVSGAASAAAANRARQTFASGDPFDVDWGDIGMAAAQGGVTGAATAGATGGVRAATGNPYLATATGPIANQAASAIIDPRRKKNPYAV